MIDKNNKPARVRFAPSPTGHLHLGGARTALYNYLLARKTNGQFILRFEDTDQKRIVADAEEEIIKGLRWLGLNWDEGPLVGGAYAPYRQSERKNIYLDYAKQLIDKDSAYYCFCTPDRLKQVREEQQKLKMPPRYDGTCRKLSKNEAQKRVDNGETHIIRFKTPKEGTTIVTDHVRGDIKVDNSSIDDYILVKSDGWALYHLAAVVDDYLMKISHVFRGSEWLPTFPLHCMIYRSFGWQEPTWVHLSVFLKPSGKGKMSKRESADLVKDGHSIFIKDLKDLGYLPDAVNNWIALMGWAYDDHSEYFSLSDLVEKFSIDKLNSAPAAINFSKLDHFNGIYIRDLSQNDLAKSVEPFFQKQGYDTDKKILKKIAPIIRERIVTLNETPEIAGFFFRNDLYVNVDDLIGKNLTKEETINILSKTLDIFYELDDVEVTKTEPLMRNLVNSVGLKPGQVFGIIRVAVTGQKVSPPLFESIEIIGKSKTIERIQNAISLLINN